MSMPPRRAFKYTLQAMAVDVTRGMIKQGMLALQTRMHADADLFYIYMRFLNVE